MTIDIALTEGAPGRALAHRSECPMVQEYREQGRFVATMFGIEGPLDPEIPRHTCLTDPAKRGDGNGQERWKR